MVDELDFDAIDVEVDEYEPVVEKKTPIRDVEITLKVVLGDTTMPIHELLRLGRGAVISLNRTEEDDISVFAGDHDIASGQLRLNGEQVEIVVTEVKLRGPEHRSPSDRFKKVA